MTGYAQCQLSDRLLDFSIIVFRLLKSLPYKKEYEVIRYQLSKSATSIGANYEESQATTYKEFPVKIRISLREALETRYWLRIIKRLALTSEENIDPIIVECTEIIKILKTILNKVNK